MGCKSLAVLSIAVAAGTVHGAIFFETEPNDSMMSADVIGTYGIPGDGVVVDGGLTSGDVDWYHFTLTDPAVFVTAAVYDLAGSATGANGLLGLFNADGVELISDDDSNIGLMPSLEIAGLAAGEYFFAVSGSPDSGFAGDHQEEFDYKLVIGLNVPTPGAAAVLGLAGLAVTRRRR